MRGFHALLTLRFHAAIIGPKGRVVNAIMQECGGVSIHFPSGPAKAKRPNIVTVKGPSEDVAKAKARLLDLATAEVWSLSRVSPLRR